MQRDSAIGGEAEQGVVPRRDASGEPAVGDRLRGVERTLLPDGGQHGDGGDELLVLRGKLREDALLQPSFVNIMGMLIDLGVGVWERRDE